MQLRVPILCVLAAWATAAPPSTAAPTGEVLRLTAGDPAGVFEFGFDVAIDGAYVLVGARGDDDNGLRSGSVFVFHAGTGQELLKLLPDDGVAFGYFGRAVGISGTTVVVGAEADASGSSAGTAYLFDATTGQQLAKLFPDDSLAEDQFGNSVGISGTRAIVGAVADDELGPNAGAAYLFDTTTAQRIAKLHGEDTAPRDRFGVSVAISGNLAVVGAKHDDDLGDSSGSAYVFDVTTGDQLVKLLPSDGAPQDRFGDAVAISGTTVIVGALRHDGLSGAAYLFDALTGQELAKLRAPFPEPGASFGDAVAIHGTLAVVGAPDEDGELVSSEGVAHVFHVLTGEWLASFTGDGDPDRFSSAVAIHGTTAVGTSPRDTVGSFQVGAVYVHDVRSVLGQSFCDASDGALAFCPCGNPGTPDSGCDIAQATGGVRLDALAQETFPLNRVTLEGSGFPPAATPAAIALRAGELEPTGPAVFGDGVRCIGTPFVRMRAEFALGGTATFTFGHGAGSGPFVYQLWYRNQPPAFCTPDAFNASSGRRLVW